MALDELHAKGVLDGQALTELAGPQVILTTEEFEQIRASRSLIGMSIGIVMVLWDVDRQEAFDLIRKRSLGQDISCEMSLRPSWKLTSPAVDSPNHKA